MDQNIPPVLSPIITTHPSTNSGNETLGSPKALRSPKTGTDVTESFTATMM